ncbi:MAG: rRNA maturation RNase YbeY [Pirellulales bacterium]
MIEVVVTSSTATYKEDDPRLRKAVQDILQGADIGHATVSVAVVDDATIQGLNRRYLDHDYPTDVLSFCLERGEDRLEGEVVVSGDTAARQAERFGWKAEEELLLYVVHGALHLVGYDDQTPEGARSMRTAEKECLARFHLNPPQHEQGIADGSSHASPPDLADRGASTP